MRVLLDTNVLIAAFATQGLCADVFRSVLAEHELLTSPKVLEEFKRALVGKLHLAQNQAKDITAFVKGHAQLVTPVKPAHWPKRDPDDRWIVAAAIEGQADVLVSGDRDLLDGSGNQPPLIVSPRGYLDLGR